MTPKTEWAAQTDVGLLRDHNEDAFFIDEQLGVGFVADGMGGHDAGEVASALAVETVQAQVREGVGLKDALLKAHKAIVAHPNGGSRRRGMGTTGVAIQVQGNQAEVAWVGDSRAYLFDGEKLYPMTKDHTPVQEMVDQGKLTVEDARVHPRRNEITQALGVGIGGKIAPSVARAYFGAGSVVLLCSDGLTEHLSDAQIADILARGTRPLEKAAERLVQAALADGGSDNVTVVMVKALG